MQPLTEALRVNNIYTISQVKFSRFQAKSWLSSKGYYVKEFLPSC